jgi:hypothetical protein
MFCRLQAVQKLTLDLKQQGDHSMRRESLGDVWAAALERNTQATDGVHIAHTEEAK